MSNANVRDEIDATVWEANAPAITVYPYALAGMGVITPSGVAVSGDSYRAKQHISFDVSYNLTNQNYTFLRWAAFEGDARLAIGNGIYGTGEYGANRVLIESDAERRTNARVTVRLDGGFITLTPVVALRPRVVSFQPDGGIATPAILTTPIVIQFSTAINPASIMYGRDGAGNPVWRNTDTSLYPAANYPAGKFKNITITGRGTFGTGAPVSFEKYFDPNLDSTNTILTFTARKDPEDPNTILIVKEKPYFSYVYVDLDGSIASAVSDEITLGSEANFNYYIENKLDTTGPVNTLILARSYSTLLVEPGSVHGGDPIYLVVAAFDQIDKANLKSMTITETFYTGTEPKPSDNTLTVPVSSINFINRYDTALYPQYAALKQNVEAAYGSLPGVLYVIPYQLRDGSTAGKVELLVVTTDQSDNPSLTWRVEGDTIVYSDRDMYNASRVVLIRE
jgi:hypothetical protein